MQEAAQAEAKPKEEAPPPPIPPLIERLKTSNGKDTEAAATLQEAIRHENIGLVIDQLEGDYPGWHPILIDALKRVVTEQDKPLILGRLAVEHDLIAFVRIHHWEQDAKAILVGQIESSSGYMPVEWIEALAQLKDPSTYPALKSSFVNGWNRHQTYRVIALLPGMELSRELPLAWEKAHASSSGYEVAYLTGPLLEVGYPPAIDYVMNQLRNPSTIPITILDPDLLSARYLDFSGTKEERLAFWDKHEKKLKFDPERRKFAR